MDNRRKRRKRRLMYLVASNDRSSFHLVRTREEGVLRGQLQASLLAIADEPRRFWAPHSHEPAPPGHVLYHDPWRGENVSPLTWR